MLNITKDYFYDFDIKMKEYSENEVRVILKHKKEIPLLGKKIKIYVKKW
jgi:hypothetical protein